MSVEIKIPSVGESISEVFIGEWYVKEGTWVDVDTNLVGLETDKATFDVPAPQAGVLKSISKKAGESAAVGETVAILEPGEKSGGGDGAPEKAAAPAEKSAPAPKAEAAAKSEPAPSKPAAGGHVMPAAARVAAQNQVNPSQVSGTGPGGRVLKEDVQQALSKPAASAPAKTSAPAVKTEIAGREERRVPMSPIRQTIARRLVEAQHNAALLTTFNECDMSGVKELRETYQDSFQKKYGIKLGFMSFFVKAVVEALNQYPQVGAQIEGNQLVYRNYCDIGVAIGGGKGLVVPVLRNVERMSFAEIELAIVAYAQKAKENKISLEDLEGGIFTITNGGVYGSLLSTPIVNPPQSGVLGMHGIFERPIALNGQVVIRPMMYVALTYDHRVVDGREAVSFLRRIKETIEEPTRLILEI
ncbi:2-oxoglutarate dehydrogenase complex dihydrolipoyllysine-residue succinyltransferase [Planctomicrobium piriforme]|uniref:Dihydrolipoyllysine-residue succinyltransferase component of 2-oxoglutarate dehydrogenase complex n=1 Tax=Planctomicrobium piriforme TaxID=1576369 RepID=A0A1I3RQ73_9PLAN|nr:2-oxoglutarate dehydrogenase complex dihydrolipoyllysine-residue succinyltransferase [Planctomicrobium piriforme]SFJ47421.1 2-oxoglutarate dehydrogenase E2 component (dihydrolipoamide succinyltransferase) [Planctomicrobium piriforme]